jgi:hypothetical protein
MSRWRMCDCLLLELAPAWAWRRRKTNVMEISQSLEKLLHVAFDLSFAEANVRVCEHAAEIVVGIGRHHVKSGALLALAALFVR